MIKVCHITTVHNSLDNRIFYKECQTLASFGYDVTLVAPHKQNEIVDNVKMVRIPRVENRIKRMLWVSTVKAFMAAVKVKADIYHFHDPELIPTGLALRLLGKKVVYDVHENTAGSILTKPYLPKAFRKFVSKTIDLVEHTFSSCFSAIVVARPDIGEKIGVNNCVVVRNFPILSVASQSGGELIHKTKKAVVYVGGMTRIRGTKELVNAFADVTDAELWLLGPFSEPDLKIECMNSPGWKNVRYFGNVPPYKVFEIIHQADVGIITFLPAPNHLTTLATKPFEYMACGLPMIMSDFEYWQNTFGELSLYVDPSSSSGISAAVNKLVKDEAKMKAMGAAGKFRVFNEFNWELESLRLKQLYTKLAGVN